MNRIAPILRSKQQARQFYNRISRIYDWLTASEEPLIRKGIEKLSPRPGERILEIGCGTGTGLVRMERAVSNLGDTTGSIVGLDLSHQMLIESQKKSQTDLLQGDATKLPVRSEIFDGVFCSFTLELFPEEEIPIVLGEIRRVLKSQGRLVVIALAKPPENMAVRLYEFAHKVFPVAIDCRPIPLKHILETNGFQIEAEMQFMNWGLPVELVRSMPA